VKATHSEVCSQVPPSLQWHSCQQVPCCAGLAHGTGGAVSSLPRRAARACIAGLHGAPRTTAHTQLLPISDGQCSADQSSMLWLGHAARGWAGGAAHGDRAPRALDAVAGERDRAVAARPARPTPLTAAHEQLCVACRVFTRTMCQAAPRSALAQQPRLCSRPTRAKSRGHILPGRGAPVALAVAQAVSAAGAVLRAVVQTGGGARHGEVVREPVDVHGIVDGSAPQPLPARGSAVLLPPAHRSAARLCRILPVALPPPSCGVRPSIPFFSALAGQHAVMLMEVQRFTCSCRLHNPLQAAPNLCTVTHVPLRVTHVPFTTGPMPRERGQPRSPLGPTPRGRARPCRIAAEQVKPSQGNCRKHADCRAAGTGAGAPPRLRQLGAAEHDLVRRVVLLQHLLQRVHVLAGVVALRPARRPPSACQQSAAPHPPRSRRLAWQTLRSSVRLYERSGAEGLAAAEPRVGPQSEVQGRRGDWRGCGRGARLQQQQRGPGDGPLAVAGAAETGLDAHLRTPHAAVGRGGGQRHGRGPARAGRGRAPAGQACTAHSGGVAVS